MPSQVVENLIDFAAFLGTADRARWELINGAVATLEATGLSPVPENLADAVNTVREMVELLGPGNAGFVGFTSEAAMDADLNHDANTVAWVPEVGYFVKTGASGAGTWDLFADEPVSPTIEIPVGQIARVPSGEADIAVFDFASRATLVRDAEDTSNNAVGDETAAGTFSRASTGYRRLRNGLYASVASDVMRITHANDLTPGGLLIEAAATNKFTANNALAAGLTGQGGATATAAAAIAGPDGATGLVALIENATTWPVSYVQRAEASAAGSNTEEWVASCWIRAVTGTIDGLIRCDTTAGNSNRNFTGITTAWQRVDSGDVFNFTSASSTNRVFRLSSLTGPAYIVWAQMEAGRTPTSYIPTSGANATRAVDTLTRSVGDLPFDTSEYGFLIETGPLSDNAQSINTFFVLDDGTGNNTVTLRNGVPGSKHIQLYVASGGVAQVNEVYSGETSQNLSMVVSCKANDFHLTVNGQLKLTNAAGALPTGITTLRIGGGPSANARFNGYIKRLVFFKKAPTKAEAVALTAPVGSSSASPTGGLSRTQISQLTTGAGIGADLNEAGRWGRFEWDATNLATEVAADTQQGLFIAPQGGNGSTGAFRRIFTGNPKFTWFGGGSTQIAATNTTAITAAAAVLKLTKHRYLEVVGSLAFTATLGIAVLADLTLVCPDDETVCTGLPFFKRPVPLGSPSPTADFARKDVLPSRMTVLSAAVNPVAVTIADSFGAVQPNANQFVSDNSYGIFEEMFQDQLGDKNVTHHMLAIGGKIYSDILLAASGPSWTNVPGKVWLDYAEDLAPDILTIAMGQNAGTDYDIRVLDTIHSAVQSWAKVPNIVWATTVLPSVQYGSYTEASMLGKTQIAGAARSFGKRAGHEIFDVHRFYTMAMHGYDPCSASMLDQEVVVAAPTVIGDFRSMPGTGISSNQFRGQAVVDTTGKVAGGPGAIIVAMGGGSRNGGDYLSLRNLANGNIGVMQTSGHTGALLVGSVVDTGVVFPSSATQKFTFEKSADDWMTVFLANASTYEVPVWRGRVFVKGGNFIPYINTNNAELIAVSATFRGARNRPFMPFATDTDMWQSSLFAGENLINHPSGLYGRDILRPLTANISLRG